MGLGPGVLQTLETSLGPYGLGPRGRDRREARHQEGVHLQVKKDHKKEQGKFLHKSPQIQSFETKITFHFIFL